MDTDTTGLVLYGPRVRPTCRGAAAVRTLADHTVALDTTTGASAAGIDTAPQQEHQQQVDTAPQQEPQQQVDTAPQQEHQQQVDTAPQQEHQQQV